MILWIGIAVAAQAMLTQITLDDEQSTGWIRLVNCGIAALNGLLTVGGLVGLGAVLYAVFRLKQRRPSD